MVVLVFVVVVMMIFLVIGRCSCIIVVHGALFISRGTVMVVMMARTFRMVMMVGWNFRMRAWVLGMMMMMMMVGIRLFTL